MDILMVGKGSRHVFIVCLRGDDAELNLGVVCGEKDIVLVARHKGTAYLAAPFGTDGYMLQIGVKKIADYEEDLRQYATRQLLQIDGLRIIGEAKEKAAVISFLVGNIHPYDMGVLLDHQGIAVRTGHHCTQPVMNHYQIPGTVRASFALYNTQEEIDRMVEAVRKAKAMLE